jgi:hypothetical protein
MKRKIIAHELAYKTGSDDNLTDEDIADQAVFDLEMVIGQQRAFILKLAERLANASDVLGMLAERKEARKID